MSAFSNRPFCRKDRHPMSTVHGLFQWLTQNPLGAATFLYFTGVIGVLVYAFFEPQDQR